MTFDILDINPDSGAGESDVIIDDPTYWFETLGARKSLPKFTTEIINSSSSSNNTSGIGVLDVTHDSSTGQTTLRVDEVLDDASTHGDVLQGENYVRVRRVTPDQYGSYSHDGSTILFDASGFGTNDFEDTVRGYTITRRVDARDAVLLSNTNRPIEVTFDQFKTPEGSQIRQIFRARLSEEEGIRAYDFYVATESAVYVANPNVAERTVPLDAVTESFGIALSPYQTPIFTHIPGGAIIKGTSGHLYALDGRRVDRLFPDGAAPWDASTLYDVAYHADEETLYIATEGGIWGYDFQRSGLTLNYDFKCERILWDAVREEVLAYAGSPPAWTALDESGSTLTAAVQTQPIMSGGQAVEIDDVQVGYDRAGYDPTDVSTLATIRQTMRRFNRTVSDPICPNREWQPPMRGAGIQFEIEGFDTLEDIRFEVRSGIA